MSEKDIYLKVINASAGSGKTYSLVKEYIHLLLMNDGENAEMKYAEILAMTFTNKAALEMKTRIIKALDELAYPDLHQSNYIDAIVESTGLKKEYISEKASHFLSGILHHYEDFHVLTIDKFNLRLIRSFSRDLDLPPDFDVVLDEKLVIEQVVDELMEEIGKNVELTSLLLKYANENIENEKSWNLRNALISFGMILSKERDFPYVKRLMETNFTKEDHQLIKAQIKALDQSYEEIKKSILRVNDQYHFVDKSFPYGKSVVAYIQKTKTAKLKDEFPFTDASIGNIEKKINEDAGAAALHEQVLRLRNFYEQYVVDYKIMTSFMGNFFNMALLKHLNAALALHNKQERLIRISEFNTMISDLLKEDTLYVYEKLGTRFRHFMLDEFQDTSRLQWKNLIPLIRESLGHGQLNFIVGDPKQAIYRFKDGVAEQFVALPGIYNPENDADLAEHSNYFEKAGKVYDLDDNWRSSKDIVDFNNDVFLTLKDQLSEEHRAFYKSVEQHPKSSKKGYVSVESDTTKLNKAEQRDNSYDFIKKAVVEAINDGFNPGDICILGRNNDFCNDVANRLSNDGYSVVSADSLNIDSELTVRFLLSYLKVRLNPVNANLIRQFAHLYIELFNKDLRYYHSLFVEKTTEGELIKTANLDLFLRENPEYTQSFFASYEGLYDLIQKAIRMFGFNELKNPYLHHFADLIHSFEIKNGPDLNLFLKNYDELSKESKALQIPESDEALKVMTIHKSKGLEFPVVVVVNEMSETLKGEFFVDTTNYLLRSSLSANSVIPEIVQASEEEINNVFLDNLNLFYVAYTRPVNRLYIKNYSSSGSTKALTDKLHHIWSQMPGATMEGEILSLKRGERLTHEAKRTATKEDFFQPEASVDNLWFPDIALQDADELKTDDFLSDERRYGNQFHIAIASIHHPNEIQKVVQQLQHEGKIETAFASNIQQDLVKLFGSETYAALFSGAKNILNEQTFIISPTELIRPDKIILHENKTVVIDYKTGAPKDKDITQIRQYRSVLEEMGYPNVDSYLLYTKEIELKKL